MGGVGLFVITMVFVLGTFWLFHQYFFLKQGKIAENISLQEITAYQKGYAFYSFQKMETLSTKVGYIQTRVQQKESSPTYKDYFVTPLIESISKTPSYVVWMAYSYDSSASTYRVQKNRKKFQEYIHKKSKFFARHVITDNFKEAAKQLLGRANLPQQAIFLYAVDSPLKEIQRTFNYFLYLICSINGLWAFRAIAKKIYLSIYSKK